MGTSGCRAVIAAAGLYCLWRGGTPLQQLCQDVARVTSEEGLATAAGSVNPTIDSTNSPTAAAAGGGGGAPGTLRHQELTCVTRVPTAAVGRTRSQTSSWNGGGSELSATAAGLEGLDGLIMSGLLQSDAEASWAVIPTVPANIYEHTIAAVPNFSNKAPPATNAMFLVVNVALVLVLVASAVLEVVLPK